MRWKRPNARRASASRVSWPTTCACTRLANRAAPRGGRMNHSNSWAPPPILRWTLAEAGHYDEAPHRAVPDALEGLVEHRQEPDQTHRVCQPDRHDDRVVRLLPLQHGRRARV